jgi:hypothetical protein
MGVAREGRRVNEFQQALFTPTEEELKEIIDEWESSHDSR